MNPEVRDRNLQREIKSPRQRSAAVLPPRNPLPGTSSRSSPQPRAEGSGVSTMNIALARSSEPSKVTPPACKKGGGGGQQHWETTARSQSQKPLRSLQSGKQMINSNTQTVFLPPRVSQIWQKQDFPWALLLGLPRRLTPPSTTLGDPP